MVLAVLAHLAIRVASAVRSKYRICGRCPGHYAVVASLKSNIPGLFASLHCPLENCVGGRCGTIVRSIAESRNYPGQCSPW